MTMLLKQAVRVGFATSALIVSLLYFPLSLHHVAIDRSELETFNIRKKSEAFVANQCTYETDLFGIRHICRKLITAATLEYSNENMSFDQRRDVLQSVLVISPSEPAYWIALANLEVLNFSNAEKIINYLRMAYLTGRSVQNLIPSRFRIALGLWENLDESDKAIALNDFKIATAEQANDMINDVMRIDEDDIREIIQILRIKNPEAANFVNLNLIFSKK